MTEKDRSRPSKFSRDIKASEGFQGGKSREELIEASRKRKAEIRTRREERKRKAAEKESQQEEEQLSEDAEDNDEMEDKGSYSKFSGTAEELRVYSSPEEAAEGAKKIKMRKERLQARRDEMKRKAAEEKPQQQTEEEYQLSEDAEDSDEMEDKSS